MYLSFEFNFKHFPLLDQELSFWMTCKCKARLRTSNIFSIIVADWKFSIRSLFIAVINNTNIAAAKDRSFVRIVGYRELCQVQVKLLSHIQREDKRFQ